MSRFDGLIEKVTMPISLRAVVLRRILRRFEIGSFEARLKVGAVHRHCYAWCTYYAAAQAKALGHKAVTIVELGVAGGNSLINLCRIRKRCAEGSGYRDYRGWIR